MTFLIKTYFRYSRCGYGGGLICQKFSKSTDKVAISLSNARLISIIGCLIYYPSVAFLLGRLLFAIVTIGIATRRHCR